VAARLTAPNGKHECLNIHMTRKTTALIFLLLLTITATGQRPFPRPGRQQPPPLGQDCAPDDRFCNEQKAAREKAMNKQRQADLKKDTDKLFQLATELKEAVDKTTENTLSLEVIRKTDEIEKLAKEVRKKMKNE